MAPCNDDDFRIVLRGAGIYSWFDPIALTRAVAAFVVVAFARLGLVTKRKAAAIAGILAVPVVLPMYLFTAVGNQVGSQLQPQYPLPLIVLFSLVLVTASSGSSTVRFTRVQTLAIFGALAPRQRRVVAGEHSPLRHRSITPGIQPGSVGNWWWHGVPFGPMAVWFVGSVAFAGLLVLLWPELPRKDVAR